MTSPPAAPVSPGRAILGVLLGLALVVALDLVFGILALVVLTPNFGPNGGNQDLWFVAAFGLGQWLYLAPIALVLRRLGARSTALGVLIGGAVAFLLASGCAALLVFVKMA